MNREQKIMLNVAILVIALCMAGVGWAAPMGTAFTYQGRLTDAYSPADGLYDFEFEVYDDAATGSQQGSTVDVNDLDVIDGYFTVQLDFRGDPNVFNDDARWLQIAVRPGELEDPNTYSALSPRQEITPVPYALKTRGIFVDADGNVGISTMQPTEKLEVNGDIKVNNIRMANSDITDSGSIRIIFDKDDGRNGKSFSVCEGPSPTELFRVQKNGNVGIGTAGPLAVLSVKKDIGSPADSVLKLITQISGFTWSKLTFAGSTINATGTFGDFPLGLNNSSSGNVLLATGGGNVGIGGVPFTRLDIQSEPNDIVLARINQVGTRQWSGLRLDRNSGEKWFIGMNDVTDDLIFRGSASNDYMVIDKTTGNVGIGTIIPAAELDVAGTVRCEVLEITGADVAEKFPATDQVKPGMVVAIDPEHPGQLCLSRGPYNRRVAGVVSGANDLAPGAVLGSHPDDQDTLAVALSGRVWVYCDARDHPIEPGELLTTAERPGHAMAVRDYQRAHGAVIGKAMTRLDKGNTGPVLVLVSLQ